MRICCLGLGELGGPIAHRLASAGHALIVYDCSDARAEKWIAADDSGAIRVPTPASGADGADVVIACLHADEYIEAVFLGPDGAVSGMREGALLVDHSARSERISRSLAEKAAEQGLHLLDAPILGSEDNLEIGTLAITFHGSERAFELARPITSAYAARIVHAGTEQAAAMENLEDM